MRLLAVMLVLLPMLARAEVYTLGSSYTWDARPEDLDGGPQWHIDCGRALVYIYDHPWAPCVASSNLWPNALTTRTFDMISFQPVPSSESGLGTDINSVYWWLQYQPDADIVIQQTWPVPSGWEAVLHGPSEPGLTNRSLAYGYELMAWLQLILPTRTVLLTRSNEMMDRIYHDCLGGGCPLQGGFGALFRDAAGHMSGGPGQYLQHNALRGAFGQTLGHQSTYPEYQVSPEVKAYLDDVIVQYVPEPGSELSLLAGIALLGALARRRRRPESVE